jgi:hypothetical protein
MVVGDETRPQIVLDQLTSALPMSANGMVRPCSYPASGMLAGGTQIRSTPYDRGAIVLRRQIEARLANTPRCLIGIQV